MIYTIAFVAKLFRVERKIVKDWIYHFSEFLNSSVNPKNGSERLFKIDDIRVLAYIFLYWEDYPDFEYIKIGLNSKDHYEHNLINNLIIELNPIFVNVSDDLNGAVDHGILIGGLSQFEDTFYLASSYKRAGDKLIELAIEIEENRNLFYPAVYNYRHSTELYLKAITGCVKQTHNLNLLFEKFEKFLLKEYKETCPDWFKNIIFEFDTFDPTGTTFRYRDNFNFEEVFIDFSQMKILMTRMEKSFYNIKRLQELH